jgi:hypothetical protein
MTPDVPALADALYRDEIARARAMSDADRLLAGPRLFERACRVMADGIRHAHPELDENGVAALLVRRLRRLRSLERP